ncbi:MAG: L-2-amino-thiazoline-4-carboxylic acid hydrolase [Oscillospiraceae bacterium]|nr:L-2-amino-thiazoline-4-carboxylic acid hydrolase [Oscillospiraceae bacterium]
MSRIINEPRHKGKLLQAIRAQLEHRAFWLYLLCDEAKKRGLDPLDFGSEAVRRCGLSQGSSLVRSGGTDSLTGLRRTLFTKPAQLVFEMDILKSTPDALHIDFHYCPLVKAWQNAGCSDAEIADLCDIAMCGDHAIGDAYASILSLPQCIAKGDAVCALRYDKIKKD